jgi:hypothetical protein
MVPDCVHRRHIYNFKVTSDIMYRVTLKHISVYRHEKRQCNTTRQITTSAIICDGKLLSLSGTLI